MILTYCNLRTLNKIIHGCSEVTLDVPQKFSGVIFAESKSGKIHQGKTNGEGSENSNHEQVDVLYFIRFF